MTALANAYSTRLTDDLDWIGTSASLTSKSVLYLGLSLPDTPGGE